VIDSQQNDDEKPSTDRMKNSSYLFLPTSLFWRVNRELLINLAGGRALLLELAHPLVATGVAQHSGFQQHPFRRLWRTMQVMTQLTFGNEEERSHALRAFHGCHKNVQGRLPKGEGRYEGGSHYHAEHPELKLWVLATLIDSALLAHEVFISPLSPSDKQSYYEDCKPMASLLGIPSSLRPASYEAFQQYLDEMLESEILHVGENARQIVAALLQPRWFRPVVQAAHFFGTGLLPERVRAMYNLRWDKNEEERLRRLATRLQWLRAHLPSCVCVSPKASFAEWRGNWATIFALQK